MTLKNFQVIQVQFIMILNFVKKIILKKVGYAFLLTSALSKIYGIYFPGGNELCLHQTCNFKRPFFVNDTLM